MIESESCPGRFRLAGVAGTMLLVLSLAACMSRGIKGDASAEASPVDTSKVVVESTVTTLPAHWQHGAFMEIFVRAWRDSDGDGIGDLRGLTQSLDYLRDLGIKGIWLMPITQSSDHDHGYAVTDFRRIEPDYGTLADFDELLREAHARGIGVIMDYVINHSSARHPLFIESRASRTGAYRDWYVWKDPAPTGWDVWGKNPWYPSPGGTFYATFGPHMPDFNLEHPPTLEYHRNNLRFWLNRGLDGFRFDAVPHLVESSAKDWNDQPGSYALMAHVQSLMSQYHNRYLVCEATASPTRWAAPYICGSAFAFGTERQFIDAARGKPEAIQAVADYFKTAPLSMATMVSNHDIFAGERLWDQARGDAAEYRLAAATYLLLPGTPFIYYGEEVGMAGVSTLGGDAPLRTPMSWTADATGSGSFTTGRPFRPASPNISTHNVTAARTDANSLLNFYKAMLQLRNKRPSISRGSYDSPVVDGRVMSYQRRLGKEHTLVAINYGKTASAIEVSGLPTNGKMEALYPAAMAPLVADSHGKARIATPAQSILVFNVER